MSTDLPTPDSYAREADDPFCQWPPGTEDMLRLAQWRRIVAVGDSVAAGIREALDGYRDIDGTGRVVEALRRHHPTLRYDNLGERDLLIAEIRQRQLSQALDLAPDLAVVAAGGNDALKRSFDNERCRAELTALIAPLVSQGAALVTIGLFDLARSGLVPEPYAKPTAERFDRLDRITAELTAEFNGVHVDNHHHPLAADVSIFASDRIHANGRGHAVAAVNLARALITLTGSQSQSPTSG